MVAPVAHGRLKERIENDWNHPVESVSKDVEAFGRSSHGDVPRSILICASSRVVEHALLDRFRNAVIEDDVGGFGAFRGVNSHDGRSDFGRIYEAVIGLERVP
jgi:hypothetical protein